MYVYTQIKFNTEEDFIKYVNYTGNKLKRIGAFESYEDKTKGKLMKGLIPMITQFPFPTGNYVIKTKNDEEIKVRIYSGYSPQPPKNIVKNFYVNLSFDKIEDFGSYIKMAKRVNVENITISKDIFIVTMWSDTFIPEGYLMAETIEGEKITIHVHSKNPQV